MAAGRRAYTDIYSSWLEDALLAGKTGQSNRFLSQEDNEIKPEFYFGDLNFKLSYNPNEKQELSISAYGSKNYLNSSTVSQRNNATIDTEDKNKWGNYGFGASWKKQWNSKSFTNLQAGHSGYYNDYYNNTVVSGNNQQQPPQNGTANYINNENNDLTDYFISFQNKYLLNQSHQFESGIAVKFNQFSFYKDADRNVVYNSLENSSVLSSIYFQDRIAFNSNFSVKPGFRTNYYNKTGKLYFEPRLTTTYTTNNGLNYKIAI